MNGQCDITLKVLFRIIATPLNMDSVAFKILVYEVLQDTVNINSLMSLCAVELDKNSEREQMTDPLTNITGTSAHPKTKNRPTICIIGVSGFIGSNLIQHIGNKYQLVLQFHQLPTEEMIYGIPHDALVYIGDLSNEELTKRIFLENKIDFAFWLAASSTQQGCQNFLSAYNTNVDYLNVFLICLAPKSSH